MRRTSYADMVCPIARSLEVIGDWWTLLILRDIGIGITRFDALQRDLGISRRVLTERLAQLVDDGVLVRTAYQERPVRYEYTPTAKGADLAGVLVALQSWGERWTFEERGTPVTLRHVKCGASVRAVPTCSNCGEELHAHEVQPVGQPALDEWPEAADLEPARERLRVAAAARRT